MFLGCAQPTLLTTCSRSCLMNKTTKKWNILKPRIKDVELTIFLKKCLIYWNGCAIAKRHGKMDPVWRSDCTQISKLLFPERWQGTKYLISCRSLSTRICHWHPKFSKNTTDYKNFRFGLFCKPNHHANYKLLLQILSFLFDTLNNLEIFKQILRIASLLEHVLSHPPSFSWYYL